MNPQEIPLLKELVIALGTSVADTEDSAKGIGTRSQMPNSPQKLKGMAFLLQWVFFGISLTVYLY
jgi:hypothetical protein